jgi:hypothetical protein
MQQKCGWKPYRMLTPTGMATADPLASNDTEGKAQNRCVAVNVLVSKSVDGLGEVRAGSGVAALGHILSTDWIVLALFRYLGHLDSRGAACRVAAVLQLSRFIFGRGAACRRASKSNSILGTTRRTAGLHLQAKEDILLAAGKIAALSRVMAGRSRGQARVSASLLDLIQITAGLIPRIHVTIRSTRCSVAIR